jgi:hypothetical protein
MSFFTIIANARRSRYTGQVMASAGLDSYSKSASITCIDLSVKVCNDFNCFNEHEFLHLLVRLLTDVFIFVIICSG